MKLLMKINICITLICFFIQSLFAEIGDSDQEKKGYSPYPQPDSGYVTDIANLLTDEEEERIEVWLWQVESKTNVEIAVVIIDSIKDYPATFNNSIESFATGLFDKYGIGNLPKNDGVLLLVAKGDRKARIELGKYYGHDRDDDAERIMQKSIIPYFKKGQYAKGITNGVEDIMYEFAGCGVRIPWNILILLASVIVLGIVAFSLFKNGKKGWGWVAVGIIFILTLVIIRLVFSIIKHMPSSSSSSWSPGGFGGGFGGGSSGGGGATGSW